MSTDNEADVTIAESLKAERPDIFLSYSRVDKEIAHAIAEQLAKKYVVWSDKGIVSGSDWRSVLDTKIKRARCVLLYWSPLAERSWWVAYEAMRANQLEKLLIVSFHDVATKSESWAKDIQFIRLTKPVFKKFWQTADWKQLERDLDHKLPRLPKYEFVGWLGGGVAHAGGVTSVEFNPFDDDAILSTGKDGRALLWSRTAARGELEQIKQENADDVIAPAQCPSGPFEHFAGADQAGRPWGINRGGFSYAGDAIFLATEAGATKLFHGKRFDGETRTLSHLSVVYPSHDASQRMVGQNQFSGGVADAAIGPDGLVLSVGGGKAVLWNWREGTSRDIQLPSYAAGRSVDCCYAPAVHSFFVTDRKGRTHRIARNGDLKEDALRQRRAPGAVIGFNQLHAERPRGSDLCVASMSPADRTIDVYQAASGAYPDKPNFQVRADYPVRGLAILPDTDVVAVASGYRPFLVSWGNSGQRVEMTGDGGDHFGQLTSIACSASGTYLVAGSEDGCISLWRDTVPRD
jgi:WD40 repeat protein